MRIAGPIHLMADPQGAFHKVQMELRNPWALAFYVIGITAASWHFGYGLYLFCAKWGITVSDRSRKAMGMVSTAIAVTFILAGLATIWAFVGPNWPNTPEKLPEATQSAESGAR
jgi:succinate dehydrogenase / fumarate reductase cytochrome b subunit